MREASVLEHTCPAAPLDQAAGLRRLFGGRRARVLPVLLATPRCAVTVSALAHLAQACAAQDTRTLAIDAARAQLAATLGLRARYDLAHVLHGDVPLEAALLDAAPGLALLPAARALEAAPGPAFRSAALPHAAVAAGATPWRQVLDGIAASGRFDLVLWLLPAPQARRAVACTGEVLLALRADARHATAALQAVRAAAEALPSRPIRPLFAGPEAPAARSLFERMAPSLLASTARCVTALALASPADARRIAVEAAHGPIAPALPTIPAQEPFS